MNAYQKLFPITGNYPLPQLVASEDTSFTLQLELPSDINFNGRQLIEVWVMGPSVSGSGELNTNINPLDLVENFQLYTKLVTNLF